MNNAVFEKTVGNVRKYGDIKLVTTERTRNCLVLEPNYHATKFFTEHEMKNEKNRNTFEQTCLFRTFNTKIK